MSVFFSSFYLPPFSVFLFMFSYFRLRSIFDVTFLYFFFYFCVVVHS